MNVRDRLNVWALTNAWLISQKMHTHTPTSHEYIHTYKLLFLTCHCLQPLFKATFANASVVMLCSCGVAVRFWL